MASAISNASQQHGVQLQTPKQVLQFVIVGKDDVPIFDADLSARVMPSGDGAGVPSSSGSDHIAATDRSKQGDVPNQRPQYLYHFVLHASLDAMDDLEWSTKSAFLGVIDRFNNLQVSGYITPGNRLRLLLLHDGKSEDQVKTFFRGVHSLLIPLVLNPFFLSNERIHSVDFYTKIRRLSKTVFGV
jgi:hypothetical protein